MSIGFEIPGFSELYFSYTSEQSLLDADIILFEPSFGYHLSYDDNYNGKTCYSSDSSFKIRDATIHWKTELVTALEHGKTVFVSFGQYEEFYLHTGQRQYSGTGRNARTTNIVDLANNYQFFPVPLGKIIGKSGKEIRFVGGPVYSSFWAEFGKYMSFRSYLDSKVDNPLFLTKTGDKVIGAQFKYKKGTIVLLPKVDYSYNEFITHEGDEPVWTEKAKQFGNRLIQVLVDIDKSLKSINERTPPPQWMADSEYEVASSVKIKSDIDSISKKINDLESQKSLLLADLGEAESLQALLYEKGKPLEAAIIKALKILGYSAENYVNGDLEIDQVIISPENERFVGEAEGKDTSQISIEKFRQLESNIQEDLQRDEVSEPAIGILFGNAFRLTDVKERGDFFTEKCLKNAQRLGSILVKTPDLFRVANYLESHKDKKFAKACRNAVSKAKGRVVIFPEIKERST